MKKCSNEICGWEWPDSVEICDVCGNQTFIDPASIISGKQETLPTCCANPDCSNLIIFNGATYCSECGSKLQSISWNAWEQKITPTSTAHFVETVLDPSRVVTWGLKFGFTEDEVERHLDVVVERLTNATRREVLAWMQTAVLSGGNDKEIQQLREDALLSARKSKISETYARRVLDELVPPVTHVSISSPAEQSADNRRSLIEGELQLSPDSREQEVIPISDYSSTDSGRNSAKSFYRHMLSGGTVTNNLVYLSSEKSAVKAGLIDRGEFLREVANKQGTFVLFADANKGWVLPNPSLVFRPRALATLFPDLTADQYNNFKQHIEPVAVTPAGKGRWKVVGRENGSAVGAVTEAITSQQQEAASDNLGTSFPISAADYLEKMRHFENVLRPDFQKGILVSDSTGKGELVLIRDSNQPDEKQPLFLIPRVTRFQTKQEFYAYYEKYYDCKKPSAGDIWIIDPATVGKFEGGWQLKKKGVLEVGEAPALREITSLRPQSHEPPRPKSQTYIPPTKPSQNKTKTKTWLVGAAILTLGLIFFVIVMWKLVSGPRGSLLPKNELMVRVEGGSFLMGRNDGEENERPQHKATVKSFYVDTYEVTREEYKKFIDTTNHRAPTGWVNGNYPPATGRWPVTGVDWYDAAAYAKWAGKRLPTEEEWELAAKGLDARKYPWGNDWNSGYSNAGNASQTLADVDKFKGASPYGAIGMVGNAWEWTATKLVAYPGGRIPPQELGDGKVDLRVIRGGSWQSDRSSATTTYRWGWPASGGKDYNNTGFRCVKDAE
jgi:formylglycine-generating enzyme required for sulfatase activity